MTRKVFVDAGAWVALADTSDDLHHAALAIYPSVLQSGVRLITSAILMNTSSRQFRNRVEVTRLPGQLNASTHIRHSLSRAGSKGR